jgi:hypothetical protein
MFNKCYFTFFPDSLELKSLQVISILSTKVATFSHDFSSDPLASVADLKIESSASKGPKNMIEGYCNT